MKKIILILSISLLAAGCSQPQIKTVSQAMDDSQNPSAETQPCKPQNAKDGTVMYINQSLGFEFEPGQYKVGSTSHGDPVSTTIRFIGPNDDPTNIENTKGLVSVMPADTDLASMKRSLSAAPYNIAVSDITVNCVQGITYSEGGTTTADFIANGNNYEISGALANPEILQTFIFLPPK